MDRIHILQCDTFSRSNDNNNIKTGELVGWGKLGKHFSDFKEELPDS